MGGRRGGRSGAQTSVVDVGVILVDVAVEVVVVDLLVPLVCGSLSLVCPFNKTKQTPSHPTN